MDRESEISLRRVGQARPSVLFLGLSSSTSPPHPQPGWNPGSRRQPTIVPCCRSTHSGATSVVRERQGGGGPCRITGMGTGGAVPELDRHGPFRFLRAVPEFAASTERLLAGLADSGRCLRGAATGSRHHPFPACTVWPHTGFAPGTPKPWASQPWALQQQHRGGPRASGTSCPGF